ncbi:hypothetical protein TanjilG_16224 [Lupinus angustifolius]|uniref:Cytochrome P450 n=1 Tax=Lupinus angustifolius TaxID=3871 RepID=A0A1J7GKF1_LUPAN|nr:hypothetical protein TanjilG_16224 [Lupinus angustifolius]
MMLEGIMTQGDTFLFCTGNIQCLMVTDIEMVKKLILYTPLNLGKPSYLSEYLKPFLGLGIVSSSGSTWLRHRKIIAPELYLDKVKAMINLMVDSTKTVISCWENKVERDGGVSEIKVDEDLQNLSADVIAKACFGSNYNEAKEIFTKLRDIQRAMSTVFSYAGIPGFRYMPIRTNREIWRIEKEIDTKILKLIKERLDHGEEKDLLQMILEGANNYEESDTLLTNSISHDRFIIDNCKNIFSAGHETTSITASWCLMLLASNQVWQDRVRAEVLQVCGRDPPNATMLRSMETLNMVIQETLRLYPPSAFVNREAIEDININGFIIPKGMGIQIPIAVMQQDPELWGNDAHKFNPERFSNGVIRAAKFPQAYIPFGIGPRVCVGQHLGMTELKVIISLILMKFQFSISPSYCHSPVFHMLIESDHGVLLKVTKI